MDNTEILQQYLDEKKGKYGTKITQTLGSGNFGTVYLTDKNFVIKLTKDIPEVKTTLKIAKELNGVVTPKFFDIKKLESGLYLIVMEKVNPISLSASENSLLNNFRDKTINLLKQNKNILTLKDALLGKLGNKMESILFGLIDAMASLFKIGIINGDIHEDNLGFIGDKLVLLDVIDDKLIKE